MKQKNVELCGKSQGKHKKKRGMSEMLLIYIVLFFAVTLLALWGFQTFFLDDFYRAEKKRDAVDACNAFAGAETDEETRRIAEQYGVCVTSYLIGAERNAETLADSHVLSHCTIHQTNIRSKEEQSRK